MTRVAVQNSSPECRFGSSLEKPFQAVVEPGKKEPGRITFFLLSSALMGDRFPGVVAIGGAHLVLSGGPSFELRLAHQTLHPLVVAAVTLAAQFPGVPRVRSPIISHP